MIIPVIDIMHNECVSGKSGRRSTYKKLRSIYGDNSKWFNDTNIKCW